ncbi:MAG TPA: helix-turn-helix transcriptional regulator [Candidatus Saccharimonadales bacterium]
MYTLPILIKKIRSEAGLTQAEFAKSIDASPVLIAMVESNQKQVSKKLLQKIANGLEVHPASITPFIYGSDLSREKDLSKVEKQFLSLGSKLQDHLIKDKAKLLRKKYDNKQIS